MTMAMIRFPSMTRICSWINTPAISGGSHGSPAGHRPRICVPSDAGVGEAAGSGDMDRHHGDVDPDDPRLGGEPIESVDAEEEGWGEDSEDPGDDVGTV